MSSNETNFTLNDIMESVEISEITNEITNKDMAIEAVEYDGCALEYVSLDLKNDFDVVIAAVTQTGGAIIHASPNMRNNLHVAVTAIKDISETISSVSPDLLREHEGLTLLASFSDDDERGAACDAYLQEHEMEFDKQRVKGSETNRSPSPLFFVAQASSPEETTPLSSSKYQQ